MPTIAVDFPAGPMMQVMTMMIQQFAGQSPVPVEQADIVLCHDLDTAGQYLEQKKQVILLIISPRQFGGSVPTHERMCVFQILEDEGAPGVPALFAHLAELRQQT